MTLIPLAERRAAATLGAAALVALLGAPAVAQQTFDMKIGYATINEIQHESARIFAEDIEKATNGRLKPRLFPASQLGGIPRMVEGIQLGTLEVLITPPAFLVGLNPAVQVLDAPAIYEDRGHAERVLADPSFREAYTGLTPSKGVIMNSLYVYDFTWIASLQPIRKFEDFRGKKIRVLATRIESEAMSRLGATGVPMDYTEVLAALQQRTVDAVRTSIVVMGGSKFFSVAKSITWDGTGIIPSAFNTSGVWFQKLPPDLQEIFRRVGREVEPKIHKAGREFEAQAEKLWRDNGAEIIRLSAADQKRLVDTLRPLGDQFLANNPATKDMYELLKLTVAKTRKAS
ncbi:MAG: TRAP transporter substrate-binding protein [Alphaproteobacteria bacterium]|nr:TRAP transporter substrate-binding protein [Alphaproteobacteria bacterium]